MEPIEYLRILRRRWWVVAGAVFVALTAVFVTTPAHAPVTPSAPSYKATNTLLQQPDLRSGNNASQATQNLSSLAFFVTAGEVPKRAAALLGHAGDPAILALDVRATADTTVGAIQVEATDSNGERAAALANTFANEFLKFVEEREQEKYQRAVDLAQTRAKELEQRVRELDGRLIGAEPGVAQLVRAERDANVRQYGTAYERLQQLVNQGPPGGGFYSVQPATPIPVYTTAFRPPSTRGARMIIVGLFALFVGTAIAFLFDKIDTRVRSKDSAEKLFGLPVIAEVPALHRPLRKRRQIALLTAPAGVVAESYRLVRTTILFASTAAGLPPSVNGNGSANGNGKHVSADLGVSRSARSWRTGGSLVVIVTSPGPGEGKTTTAANLAAAFAEWGRSVLVLSCDLRRPEVHKYLGIDGVRRGIVDLLLATPANQTIDLASVVIETPVPGVRIAPAGTKVENPGELLVRAPELVTRARELADVVIIDTGPLLLMSDATELVPLADVALVVARDGRTGAEPARRSAELLTRLAAPTLGVVLLGARQLATGRRRYYRYRYSKPGSGVGDRVRAAVGVLGRRGRAEIPNEVSEPARPSVDPVQNGTAVADVGSTDVVEALAAALELDAKPKPDRSTLLVDLSQSHKPYEPGHPRIPDDAETAASPPSLWLPPQQPSDQPPPSNGGSHSNGGR